MSRSKKGSPKLGSVQGKFKREHNRSQKMKLKANARKMAENQEEAPEIKQRKSHRWDYF